MNISQYDGLPILDVPYPVWYIRPFRWIFRKLTAGRSLPTMSQKASRLYLMICGLASLILMWMFEGFGNPLELFVDIPTFDFSLYGKFALFHMILVLFFTALLLQLIYLPVRSKETKFFSVDGMLMWVIGAAVGMLADSVARAAMDSIVMPTMLEADGQMTVSYVIVMLMLHAALFFVLNDCYAMAISVELVPLLSTYYTMLIPTDNFFGTPLIRQLIITFALSALMSLIAKTGIVEKVCRFVIKYATVPRYIPYMFIITIPFYHPYIKRKEQERQRQQQA